MPLCLTTLDECFTDHKQEITSRPWTTSPLSKTQLPAASRLASECIHAATVSQMSWKGSNQQPRLKLDNYWGNIIRSPEPHLTHKVHRCLAHLYRSLNFKFDVYTIIIETWGNKVILFVLIGLFAVLFFLIVLSLRLPAPSYEQLQFILVVRNFLVLSPTYWFYAKATSQEHRVMSDMITNKIDFDRKCKPFASCADWS